MDGSTQPNYLDKKHKEVKNDVGVSFKLGRAQPNVPITVNTKLNFNLRYKKCTLWFICWHDTDHQEQEDTDREQRFVMG